MTKNVNHSHLKKDNLFLNISIFILLLGMGVPGAQVFASSSLVTPTPGDTLSNSSVTFQWTPGNGVSLYFLGVGTSPEVLTRKPFGNIFAQGVRTKTELLVSHIPLTGNPVFVRLWWKQGSIWLSTDYKFQTINDQKSPSLISPLSGSAISTSSETFQWTPGNEVSIYFLGVGTSPEVLTRNPFGDIFAQGVRTETELFVSNIPLTGKPIFVRFWWKQGTKWLFIDHRYDTLSTPPLIEFRSYPSLFDTNLSRTIVQGKTSPGDMIKVNNAILETDKDGNFVTQIPLSIGENIIELVIDPVNGEREIVSKTINYKPRLSTADRRLLYVDVVDIRTSEDPKGLNGTIVIDLDKNVVLGFMIDIHVRGITPNGKQIFMNDKIVINTEFHQPTSLKLNCSGENIPSNAFLVSPLGDFVICGDEILDLSTNVIRTQRLPLSISSGTAFGGGPISGRPAISPDGATVFAGPINQRPPTVRRIAQVSLPEHSIDLVAPVSGPFFLSDLKVSPDNRYLFHVSYCCRNGVRIFDMHENFSLKGKIGAGDFSGEVVFSPDGKRAIVGSAGNPRNRGGGLTVINMDSFESEFVAPLDLADNLVSTDKNEIVVSSGNRVGLDIYILQKNGKLERKKSFFLGINKFIPSSGLPENDEIRRIIYKPTLN